MVRARMISSVFAIGILFHPGLLIAVGDEQNLSVARTLEMQSNIESMTARATPAQMAEISALSAQIEANNGAYGARLADLDAEREKRSSALRCFFAGAVTVGIIYAAYSLVSTKNVIE